MPSIPDYTYNFNIKKDQIPAPTWYLNAPLDLESCSELMSTLSRGELMTGFLAAANP
jgi:hypothetical protein